MKKIIALFLFVNLSITAQKTMNVDLTITYKGAPLCYWDVTLKHGDVAISKGKTDDQGNVKFSNVGLLSLSVDASGIKKTNNGEKKWDVKGYIQLNDQGVGKFDFEPLVKDAGMPVSMLEAAWGLTLADCAKGNTSSSSSNSSASSPTKSESSTNSNQAPPKEEEKEESAADIAKSSAETLQNTKAMQESKVSNLTSKIAKKTTERSKYTAFTKEHSALSYEIKDLELDKELTQVKLDKTNAMIAKGNMPLNKSERESFNQREDAIKESQSKLEQSKKAGILFDGVNYEAKKETIQTAPVSTPVNNSPTTEKKSETMESKEVKETKEESFKASETEAKPEKGIQLMNTSDLAAMSVINLKKLKLEQNSKIASRKVSLKAKSTLRPAQIEQYEKDIKVLEENIILLDIEITKRG
jgi:hypothetical protein